MISLSDEDRRIFFASLHPDTREDLQQLARSGEGEGYGGTLECVIEAFRLGQELQR